MSSPSASDSASAPQLTTCPSCQAQASGKFCSNCGATLGAANCAYCNAPLSPGAKFCHRCGTPAGAEGGPEQRGIANALPWAIAGIAFIAVIALVAGQRFARTPDQAAPAGATAAAPFANGGGSGQPPDLSSMTPEEAASRLYDRVMAAHERGQTDTVQMFAPMAMTAYQMIGKLNADQHYDLGRLAAVAGEEPVAHAQADTILASNPTHLLGLILAANAAHLRKDAAAEKSYRDKLAANAASERKKNLPEYTEHANDIDIALDPKRPVSP